MRERLRATRIRSGLSQRRLGILAGLNPSHVGLLESGEIDDVRSSAASALARVLGASLDWLVSGIGAPPSDDELLDAVNAANARAAEESSPSAAAPEKAAS